MLWKAVERTVQRIHKIHEMYTESASSSIQRTISQIYHFCCFIHFLLFFFISTYRENIPGFSYIPIFIILLLHGMIFAVWTVFLVFLVSEWGVVNHKFHKNLFFFILEYRKKYCIEIICVKYTRAISALQNSSKS